MQGGEKTSPIFPSNQENERDAGSPVQSDEPTVRQGEPWPLRGPAPGPGDSACISPDPQGPRAEWLSQVQDTRGQAGRTRKVFPPPGVTRPPQQRGGSPPGPLARRPAGRPRPGPEEGLKLGCPPRGPQPSSSTPTLPAPHPPQNPKLKPPRTRPSPTAPGGTWRPPRPAACAPRPPPYPPPRSRLPAGPARPGPGPPLLSAPRALPPAGAGAGLGAAVRGGAGTDARSRPRGRLPAPPEDARLPAHPALTVWRGPRSRRTVFTPRLPHPGSSVHYTGVGAA